MANTADPVARVEAMLQEGPAEPAPEPQTDACELCAAPLEPSHRHIVDLYTRELLCACRACALLFDREAAGGEHYRLISDRRLRLEGFRLDDAAWERMRIPVNMAFFFRNSVAGRTVAFYPSPMGATESLLELDAWSDIEAANPILREMEPDVEALLVNRARATHDHLVVPVDVCYELVALMRTKWKGLGGGPELWEAIDRFFERLREEANAVSSDGQKETEAA